MKGEYDPPNSMKRWVILVLVLAMLVAACFVGPGWMPEGPPVTSNEML
jgi:hypothetical protein